MHLILELLAVIAFVGSTGVLFHERYRKSLVLVTLAGLIAAGSTVLLLKEGWLLFSHQIATSTNSSKGPTSTTKHLLPSEDSNNSVPTRVFNVTIKVFRSYVCMSMVNYYAQQLAMYAEMVTDAPRATTPKEIDFRRPDGSMICGKIKLKNAASIGAARTVDALDRQDPSQLSQINADAFENVRDRIKTEAFRIANEFLPPNNITDPDFAITNIEWIAEEYQEDLETRLKRSGMVAVLGASLPEATGPDINIITNHMPDAARRYASYMAWEAARSRAMQRETTPARAAP